MDLCGSGKRINCVVDGDTFWLRGEKVRIADVDTPEISQPSCESELQRGVAARDRLLVLLNEGPFALVVSGRLVDRNGRKLRIVVRNGRSLGDQLVAEGLARTWDGKRRTWCD
ncbi:thermonuclease family protein [Sinorhizobium meliloti]|nr:thermonuclease family protein [Sinorhizobium meliloti]MDW9473394.1 thermonuclease family protein [Sinorhizobium meliloti]RVP23697.1 thermonuclease family protein [Sinorhizobium meliloti]